MIHTVCCAGGAGIGLVNGLYASIVTRFTRHVRVVEPLIIMSSAYFAFLVAELFHWSGIISIIAFGITVKRYGFQNLSKKSYTTVKYAIKTMASVSDCIIFIFLGLELIQESHHWHPEFIIATILLCLVFRLELPTNIREDLFGLFGFDRYHTDIVMVQSSK